MITSAYILNIGEGRRKEKKLEGEEGARGGRKEEGKRRKEEGKKGDAGGR